jgi:hypothetical protein
MMDSIGQAILIDYGTCKKILKEFEPEENELFQGNIIFASVA